MQAEAAGKLLQVPISGAAASGGPIVVVVAVELVALRTHFEMDPEHCTPHETATAENRCERKAITITSAETISNCGCFYSSHGCVRVCVHLSVYLFLCATFHGCHFDLLHSQFGNCFGPTRWTYLRFAGLCNLSILICTRSLAFFASECIQFNLTAAQQRKLKNTNILLVAKYRGTRSHYV